jgi:quercetin dioxygenase-like cupin family protein
VAGEVADWIYVSSGLIHSLVFGLGPGGAFRHSRDHRTIFAADELLYVLEGVMAIANPATGEVQRVQAGESVFFGRDTWHHAFAHGGGPLRVLELFAPPPSTGSSGAYAQQQPYLEESSYADDSVLGRLPQNPPATRTLWRMTRADATWTRDLGALVGLLASTDHLTAGLVEVDPGGCAEAHAHGGDEVIYVTHERLTVRAWDGDDVSVFELGPDDACYLPKGCRHEYRNYGFETAQAVFGVAPGYRPDS